MYNVCGYSISKFQISLVFLTFTYFQYQNKFNQRRPFILSFFRGKCEPYVGKVCSDYIQSRQRIFISENRTQRGYEIKLNQSLPRVVQFSSSKCRNFALKALCYYFFPPCQEDNITPNLICRKDCEILEAQICSKEFQYTRTMPIGGEIIPKCENLPVKQETCLELGVSGEYVHSPVTLY